MEKMHIAFCTDTNYIMPCGIAMLSVCENHLSEDIVFHCVITAEELSENERDFRVAPLREIANQYKKEIRVYYIREQDLESFQCWGVSYISTTAFARIFLPNILPLDVQKVLYLDGDLVVDGSLKPLWEIPFEEDCPVGAMIDIHGNSPKYRANVQTPLSIPYCNSGVLLMNLACWRREHLAERLAECARHHKFPFLDQDVLNYVLQGRIKILPIIYNLQTLVFFERDTVWMIDRKYLEEVRAAKEDPIVIHYIGANKPWLAEYCPKSEVWEKYKRKSVWKDDIKGDVLVEFEKSQLFNDIEAVYWNDAKLLIETMPSFLRYYEIAVCFKSKYSLMKMVTSVLEMMTHFLKFVRKQKLK